MLFNDTESDLLLQLLISPSEYATLVALILESIPGTGSKYRRRYGSQRQVPKAKA